MHHGVREFDCWFLMFSNWIISFSGDLRFGYNIIVLSAPVTAERSSWPKGFNKVCSGSLALQTIVG